MRGRSRIGDYLHGQFLDYAFNDLFPRLASL